MEGLIENCWDQQRRVRFDLLPVRMKHEKKSHCLGRCRTLGGKLFRVNFDTKNLYCDVFRFHIDLSDYSHMKS